jgi:hypothetical protein
MRLPWTAVDRVANSFAGLDLKDVRRDARFVGTLRRLAKSPSVSFPEAMGSDAELQGGYRLLNNSHVSFKELMDAYSLTTSERAREAKRVLCIHDTTTCEFAHADAEDVGFLNTGKAGFFFHYGLVVAPEDRKPLGVAFGEALTRAKPPSRRGTRLKRLTSQQSAKNQDREFLRWHRGIAAAEVALQGCEVLHIADRESDSYELMARCIQDKSHFVFRTRVFARRAEDSAGNHGSVHELAALAAGRLTREVPLARRKARPALRTAHPSRKARMAELEFSATRTTLKRPHYGAKDLPPTITVNLVRVFEPSPPDGEEPIEWLLYTTEPVDTSTHVAAVVDAYRARWLIEECNKALKTGCLYEHREFESLEALLCLLAMSLPIACEILWLRSCARASDQRPGGHPLTAVQLQVLRTMGKKKLPAQPTAYEVMMAIADMAGHHRSNGDPGWLKLHQGMSKLIAYAEGWQAAVTARATK